MKTNKDQSVSMMLFMVNTITQIVIGAMLHALWDTANSAVNTMIGIVLIVLAVTFCVEFTAIYKLLNRRFSKMQEE